MVTLRPVMAFLQQNKKRIIQNGIYMKDFDLYSLNVGVICFALMVNGNQSNESIKQ